MDGLCDRVPVPAVFSLPSYTISTSIIVLMLMLSTVPRSQQLRQYVSVSSLWLPSERARLLILRLQISIFHVNRQDVASRARRLV